MAVNVEIKARARDFNRQAMLAEHLGKGVAEQLIQEDTFFNVPNGRLKLRVFEDGSGELIQYQRADASGPTVSRYIRSPADEPATLKKALAKALGIKAVVRKRRTLYLAGQTRIHLDRVAGLGDYIELEVVLESEAYHGQGVCIARDLMAMLEIGEGDLVECAYVDLLLEKDGRPDGTAE